MFCPCSREQKKGKLHWKKLINSWFWPWNCTMISRMNENWRCFLDLRWTKWLKEDFAFWIWGGLNDWKKTLLFWIWGEINDFAKKRLFQAITDRQTDTGRERNQMVTINPSDLWQSCCMSLIIRCSEKNMLLDAVCRAKYRKFSQDVVSDIMQNVIKLHWTGL